jgi:hypothetical protein
LGYHFILIPTVPSRTIIPPCHRESNAFTYDELAQGFSYDPTYKMGSDLVLCMFDYHYSCYRLKPGARSQQL